MDGKEKPSRSGGPSLALGMSKIPLKPGTEFTLPSVSSRVEDLSWRKSDRTE